MRTAVRNPVSTGAVWWDCLAVPTTASASPLHLAEGD